MSTTMILFLQSLLISLQMINASLGVVIKDPAISVIAAAAIGGFQYFVQNVGNKMVPPPAPQPK
jgi:hypothetical protein